MSTISKAIIVDLSECISQGDVFRDVRYNYISDENNDEVRIEEILFPLAIVISQACDVIAMSNLYQNKKGQYTKFMPSVLMCPIYEDSSVRSCEHINEVVDGLGIMIDDCDKKMYHTNDRKIAEADWHYRFHSLEVDCEGSSKHLSGFVIDFKHCFCLPISYLIKNRSNRAFRLKDIYAEQITLKFSAYLARVPMPD